MRMRDRRRARERNRLRTDEDVVKIMKGPAYPVRYAGHCFASFAKGVTAKEIAYFCSCARF